MTTYGYARVSTDGQSLASQDAQLHAAGLRFNEHLEEDGPIVFKHACKLGPEGIVSKRKGARELQREMGLIGPSMGLSVSQLANRLSIASSRRASESHEAAIER
jgi:hypothetical protein